MEPFNIRRQGICNPIPPVLTHKLLLRPEPRNIGCDPGGYGTRLFHLKTKSAISREASDKLQLQIISTSASDPDQAFHACSLFRVIFQVALQRVSSNIPLARLPAALALHSSCRGM